ncbi:Predicted metal-dependent phosphoesterase, PHP family [metagenome]|uniref:Predicted metal-dependent phosphoesterase, PHP family n=1 Tax=metagenome TaxID=256318 RepID=A0A2P2CFZ1_9ZZZZ
MVRIDLHTHSDRSDGTMSPTELVEHAAEVGLDVLAITDHDCFDGWDEASRAAQRVGLTLLRGIEISCRFAGESTHLLGYLPDSTYPPLAQELARVIDGRNSRLPALLARLRDLGIDIDIHDVRRVAGEATAMGRPHVADALVEKGVVLNRDEAFARFLGPGRPAYVDRYAADLTEMIGLVAAAGGVSVVAHPWAGRHDSSALDEPAFGALRAAGLAGIEVDHQDHTAAKRARLRELADALDLVATGSSDFHGAGKVDFDLGCNTTDPAQFERLMALATVASLTSGRDTPALEAP